MYYQQIEPPPHLKAYIRCFWVFEGDASAANTYVYRSLADACVEILFHYKGTFTSLSTGAKEADSIMHGPSSMFNRYVTGTAFGIFGAYLYPYTVPLLVNTSSTEMADQSPDLNTLFKQEGTDLEEKIMTASNLEERIAILSQFIEGQIVKRKQKTEQVFAAIQYVIHTDATLSVEQLANRFCISKRQLERKFKEFAGYSPKLYTRIVRFQNATKAYGNRNKSLLDIALECGYYDQSHFIHEFKKFSGYHPGDYFHGKPEGAEYKEA